MTEGHRHFSLKARKDGWVLKALTFPLFVLPREHLDRVLVSPYPYSVLLNDEVVRNGRVPEEPDDSEQYGLSLLGFLHRWTGLVINTK